MPCNLTASARATSRKRWQDSFLAIHAESKKRYVEKLELVDRYEVAKGDWQDDVYLMPAITQLQVCMYLIRVPTALDGQSGFNSHERCQHRSRSCADQGHCEPSLVCTSRSKSISFFPRTYQLTNSNGGPRSAVMHMVIPCTSATQMLDPAQCP